MTTTENTPHILIFTTNINTSSDKERVGEAMKTQSHVEDWSVDLDDIDRVLRVVSRHPKPEQIIHLMNETGYQCRELD